MEDRRAVQVEKYLANAQQCLRWAATAAEPMADQQLCDAINDELMRLERLHRANLARGRARARLLASVRI